MPEGIGYGKDALETRRKRGSPSRAKAREILSHGTVHGKPLTEAQRGFMGARASGAPMRRRRKRR